MTPVDGRAQSTVRTWYWDRSIDADIGSGSYYMAGEGKRVSQATVDSDIDTLTFHELTVRSIR